MSVRKRCRFSGSNIQPSKIQENFQMLLKIYNINFLLQKNINVYNQNPSLQYIISYTPPDLSVYNRRLT